MDAAGPGRDVAHARQAQPRSLSAGPVRTPRTVGGDPGDRQERTHRPPHPGARRALRPADRYADAPVRDAARHDRGAGARRERRGAHHVGAAPAPARPARRRAGAPGRPRAPDPRPGAGRRRPVALRQPGHGRHRRAAALGQRPRDRARAPVRRAPGRHARARSCASATASSPRSGATGGTRSTPPSGPGCSAPRRPRSGASSAAWRWCARATGRCWRSPGLAVSAPQPPGSTFKIITLSGALAAGVATPSSAFPGAHVRDALGRHAAQRGRRVVRRHADAGLHRLVQLGLRAARGQARRQAPGDAWRRPSGSTSDPRVPDAKPSTIPPAAQADRQPRGRRERDRPGPRPRDAAADGGGGGDDRRARAPGAPAHRAQRQGRCAGAWSARASPVRCAR